MSLSPENRALVERHCMDAACASRGLLYDAAELNRLLDAAREEAASELGPIKARLADNEKLEWFVYEIFYANPIAFARQNLVIALQRHLLGLPLTTPEEEQRKMLDDMTHEERAEWWRAENARRLVVRGIELVVA